MSRDGRSQGKPRNIRRKTRFQGRIDSNNAMAKARGLGARSRAKGGEEETREGGRAGGGGRGRTGISGVLEGRHSRGARGGRGCRWATGRSGRGGEKVRAGESGNRRKERVESVVRGSLIGTVGREASFPKSGRTEEAREAAERQRRPRRNGGRQVARREE